LKKRRRKGKKREKRMMRGLNEWGDYEIVSGP
jgi:hypothetical protein